MLLFNRKHDYRLIMGVCAVALVAGCASEDRPIDVGARVAPQSQGPMVSDTPVRIGDPYRIGGRSYTPVDQTDYDEVGYASWYGYELEGNPTANGEPFRSNAISAAHRTLPLPSYVEVTRLDTGQTILVRINDRGPADANRLIDLSAGAAEQLGITEVGIVPVRVRRTTPAENERATLRGGMSVQDRLMPPESILEILRERVARMPVPAGFRPSAPARGATAGAPQQRSPASAGAGAVAATSPNVAASQNAAGSFVVQVAAFGDLRRAEALARRIGATVASAGAVHRVRYGPFATEAEAQAAVGRARTQGQPGAVIQRVR